MSDNIKTWRFDRYLRGCLMAEGVIVHAETEAQALQKAKNLWRGKCENAQEFKKTDFVLDRTFNEQP